MIEFVSWGKTPRLFRDVVVTEKIDGTNAAVIVSRVADYIEPGEARGSGLMVVDHKGSRFSIGAQSRKKLLSLGSDNYGFAAWVAANAERLVELLGEGHHFGEWWGHGIQCGYGLPKGERRFSLFRSAHYAAAAEASEGLLSVVPVLYEGPFSLQAVRHAMADLSEEGSVAAPGWMRPEGVIVFHSASRQVYKSLIESDHLPKSLVA